jgi:hypothetical protein
MKTLHLSKVIVLLIVALNSYSPADAEVIYESSTMGPTGQTTGTIISNKQFFGSRFYISQQTQVTAIGGHLAGCHIQGGIFGAIVSIDSFSDFPNGHPFNTTEVIAYKVFTPTFPSSDYRTSFSAELSPGYYALVFGSGLYGAKSETYMPALGQTDLSSGQYIFWDGYYDSAWKNVIYGMGRFVVEGTVVPEPSSLLLFSLGAAIVRKRR